MHGWMDGWRDGWVDGGMHGGWCMGRQVSDRLDDSEPFIGAVLELEIKSFCIICSFSKKCSQF